MLLRRKLVVLSATLAISLSPLLGRSNPALAEKHCCAPSAAAENAAVGIQGYDLVSYRNGKKPVQGNGNFVSTHQGVTYLFSTKANKDAFDRCDLAR